MEVTKEQKKSKPVPAPTKELQALIDIGIPLRKAIFHRTVSASSGEPEYAFYAPEKNIRPNRIAKMWYTPHGIVWEQMGMFKLIPLANVSETTVL